MTTLKSCIGKQECDLMALSPYEIIQYCPVLCQVCKVGDTGICSTKN